MTAVPDLDLHKIRDYAVGRVPAQHQDKIRMEVDVRGKTVTILECRPPWHEKSGTEWTRQGVARMKYDSDHHEWTLYWILVRSTPFSMRLNWTEPASSGADLTPPESAESKM